MTYTNHQLHHLRRALHAFLGDGQKDYSGDRNTVHGFKSFCSLTKQVGLIPPYLSVSVDKQMSSTYQWSLLYFYRSASFSTPEKYDLIPQPKMSWNSSSAASSFLENLWIGRLYIEIVNPIMLIQSSMLKNHNNTMSSTCIIMRLQLFL